MLLTTHFLSLAVGVSLEANCSEAEYFLDEMSKVE